jgi:branched-chain amino acid transport system substrate-binding protein
MKWIAFAMLAACWPTVHAATDVKTIVIGQSLPLTGPAYPIANRVQAGAKAWVERVNARGGVNGRLIEVVTLDDGDDIQRLDANLRRLVQERGAVAIVNCLGERACAQAAATTAELGVPLVGTFSGAASLRTPAMTHVFPLRADDRHEAAALAGQLRAMGVSRVAWLADGEEPSREQWLADALKAEHITATRIAVLAADVGTALQAAAKAATQALLISLGPAATDALSRAGSAHDERLPSLVATSSSPSLTQLTRLFRDRTVGFTSAVPNPEVSQLPLVREFGDDAETYVGPEAVSFEGLAAYIHLRVCTAALRAAGPRLDGRRLADALEHLGSPDLGGLRVQLSPGRRQGVDLVEIGLRTRDGKLRR